MAVAAAEKRAADAEMWVELLRETEAGLLARRRRPLGAPWGTAARELHIIDRRIRDDTVTQIKYMYRASSYFI